MRASTTAKKYMCAATPTQTPSKGFFSILKRGVIGTFHHVSEAHLHRYLAEFDFRYNTRTALGVTDVERAKELDPWRARQAPHVSTACGSLGR